MEENWLKILEIFGLLFGITYVIGAILEKKWCWHAGILATILYGISVFYAKLYGEFILQFFYLTISFYGLNQWKKTEINKDQLSISFSSLKFLTYNVFIGIIISIAFYFILIYFKGDYPFWDALTSGFGVTTTYLVAKKKIENWIFWIIIDVILCYILHLKGYSFYSILYLVYALFSLFGLYRWNKEMYHKEQ